MAEALGETNMRAAIKCAIIVAAVVAWASPVKAQSCSEGFSFCGFVWNDANGDGIQNDDPDNDATNGDQSGLSDLTVTLYKFNSATGQWDFVAEEVTTDGFYSFLTPTGGFDAGLYKVVVSAPMGTESTLQGQGGDNSLDSDGVNDAGGSAQQIQMPGGFASQEFDFGFTASEVVVVSPGTGTQGYWKNHPEAWAAAGGSVLIGGTTYTWDTAVEYMGKVSKNKVISLFVQLVAAKLNVAIGNDASCIAARIAEADAWMALHPVEGPAVLASSTEWLQIAAAHKDLDDYNNGRLCAPHRN